MSPATTVGPLGPKAGRALLERDQRLYFRQAGSTPCLAALKGAQGIWLEDYSGHRFMDLHGNNAHHIGYGHPRLVEAVRRQIETLPFVPRRFTNEAAVELAERLIAGWPGGEGKVLLATGGSDAIEIALKLARVRTGRYKTLSFYGSYHGSGLGALSVGGRHLDRPRRLGPLMPGALHVPPFYPLASGPLGIGCEDAATERERAARFSLEAIGVAFQYEGDIAALIAEPIRSVPHIPPDWYWPEVRALCDAHGTLLIFDEIPTGLGKTGRFWASEHFGVRPDATVLGKSLGGGLLPIAAVIADRAFDVATDLTLGHYTHEKNPVTARAALATLQIIDDEGLVGKARRVGDTALDWLRDLASRRDFIREVRGKGLLLAIELRAGAVSGRAAGELAEAVGRAAFRRGVSLATSSEGTIGITAPLVISEGQMLEALERLDDAFDDATAHPAR